MVRFAAQAHQTALPSGGFQGSALTFAFCGLPCLVAMPIYFAMSKPEDAANVATPADTSAPATQPSPAERPKEIGGPPGPEPTRYGDWQYNGRVTDF